MAFDLWYYRTASSLVILSTAAYTMIWVAMFSDEWVSNRLVRIGLYETCVSVPRAWTCRNVFDIDANEGYHIASLALLSTALLLGLIGTCTYAYVPVASTFFLLSGGMAIGAAIEFKNGIFDDFDPLLSDDDLGWGYWITISSGAIFLATGTVLIGINASQGCTMEPLKKKNVKGEQSPSAVAPAQTTFVIATTSGPVHDNSGYGGPPGFYPQYPGAGQPGTLPPYPGSTPYPPAGKAGSAYPPMPLSDVQYPSAGVHETMPPIAYPDRPSSSSSSSHN